MSKKKLTVITKYAHTADFLLSELKSIFADEIELDNYYYTCDKKKSSLEADLFLVPDRSVFAKARSIIKGEHEMLVINRTLTKTGFNKLMQVEPATEAMLVNVNANMAIDTISLIYQLGVRHVKLTPASPDMDQWPKLNFAITPGEKKYVPEFVDKVLDIGDRVIDISTILDIIHKFDMNNFATSKQVKDYIKRSEPISFGLEKMIGKTNRLESQFDMISDLLDVGIIGVNMLGAINFINEKTLEMFEIDRSDVVDREAEKIFSSIPFKEVLNNSQSIKDKLVKIDGWDIILTVNPIINNDTIYGATAIVKKFSDTEKKQHSLRARLINKGHVAKYNFSDITGKSDKLLKSKQIAQRMASSNSTILLTGESGTGKELFAQAIHNNSNRKNYQFVAINCAALPASLLESELFGYAEGAFTGAKKEGKAGLFELAHKGTLLLDEIGEMPMQLQSRLLRVLEEREVMRIGGDRIINIDLRIIAASNRDLHKLVKEKKFRQDLYYRLNILPLRIPPLRERKKDIPLLIEQFKKEFNTNIKLSPLVTETFFNHNWEGNIRELRNYIEYLANLRKDIIRIDDLPFTLNEQKGNLYQGEEKEELLKNLRKTAKKQFDSYIFVLKELQKRYDEKKRAGRRSIARTAQKQNIFISEQEVRKILKDLQEYELVIRQRGRSGTRITELGAELLKTVKEG